MMSGRMGGAGPKEDRVRVETDYLVIGAGASGLAFAEDWARMVSRTWRAERAWLGEPDVARWVAESRLNLLRALPDRAGEPAVQTALERYLTHVGPAIERLERLAGSGRGDAVGAA
jgi:hypothetical protein